MDTSIHGIVISNGPKGKAYLSSDEVPLSIAHLRKLLLILSSK